MSIPENHLLLTTYALIFFLLCVSACACVHLYAHICMHKHVPQHTRRYQSPFSSTFTWVLGINFKLPAYRQILLPAESCWLSCSSVLMYKNWMLGARCGGIHLWSQRGGGWGRRMNSSICRPPEEFHLQLCIHSGFLYQTCAWVTLPASSTRHNPSPL